MGWPAARRAQPGHQQTQRPPRRGRVYSLVGCGFISATPTTGTGTHDPFMVILARCRVGPTAQTTSQEVLAHAPHVFGVLLASYTTMAPEADAATAAAPTTKNGWCAPRRPHAPACAGACAGAATAACMRWGLPGLIGLARATLSRGACGSARRRPGARGAAGVRIRRRASIARRCPLAPPPPRPSPAPPRLPSWRWRKTSPDEAAAAEHGMLGLLK
jgi:hypothetical protein